MESIKRETHTIDVKDKVLGRISTRIAILLRGKHKADYLPRMDCGDFVVIKNAKEIRVTGKKVRNKVYYHHTGYLGGIRAVPFYRAMEKDYKKVIRDAVYGMLPKNRLRAKQIKRLKVE
jgi:large subunit ribosomal protein L13